LSIEAFMLPAGAGANDKLMALWHQPALPPDAWRGLVLYVHPFAEEMNKTRRMAALQARALAERGYGVLQIDLKGCGDSSGEFGDASWADWLADLQAGLRWLRARSAVPITLWGMRAGCLLASEAAVQWTAAAPHERCSFIFWQPTPNGAAVLRQFLRTAAATAFMDGGGKGVVETLRQQLGAGQAIEVGGYRVNPALAAGLEQARLVLPSQVGHVGHVQWLEVSAIPSSLSPAAQAATLPWRAAAASFAAQVVSGPPFWQTAEIETAPALIEATNLGASGQP